MVSQGPSNYEHISIYIYIHIHDCSQNQPPCALFTPIFQPFLTQGGGGDFAAAPLLGTPLEGPWTFFLFSWSVGSRWEFVVRIVGFVQRIVEGFVGVRPGIMQGSSSDGSPRMSISSLERLELVFVCRQTLGLCYRSCRSCGKSELWEQLQQLWDLQEDFLNVCQLFVCFVSVSISIKFQDAQRIFKDFHRKSKNCQESLVQFIENQRYV